MSDNRYLITGMKSGNRNALAVGKKEPVVIYNLMLRKSAIIPRITDPAIYVLT
jgi:hypothetical protein